MLAEAEAPEQRKAGEVEDDTAHDVLVSAAPAKKRDIDNRMPLTAKYYIDGGVQVAVAASCTCNDMRAIRPFALSPLHGADIFTDDIRL